MTKEEEKIVNVPLRTSVKAKLERLADEHGRSTLREAAKIITDYLQAMEADGTDGTDGTNGTNGTGGTNGTDGMKVDRGIWRLDLDLPARALVFEVSWRSGRPWFGKRN